MARAYLGLGGNTGDPRALIAEALHMLDATPGISIVARSGDYETPPWGDVAQPPFINAAAIAETTLSPQDLLAQCLDVERRLGRTRTRKWGPRNIDIDLLDYDGLKIETEGLVLPHARILERAFALVPLADIAPDAVIAGVPIRDALNRLDLARITRLADRVRVEG